MAVTVRSVSAGPGTRRTVTLSSGETISLEYGELFRLELRPDVSLSERAVCQIRAAAAEADAYEAACGYLQRRRHFRQELGLKMRRKGVPSDAAAAALRRLEEQGALDDGETARAFLREPRNTVKGRRRLLRELAAKGIDRETAAAALTELETDTDFRERCRETARRKAASLPPRLPLDKRREKLTRFLLTRGFDYDDIRSALDTLVEDAG